MSSGTKMKFVKFQGVCTTVIEFMCATYIPSAKSNSNPTHSQLKYRYPATLLPSVFRSDMAEFMAVNEAVPVNSASFQVCTDKTWVPRNALHICNDLLRQLPKFYSSDYNNVRQFYMVMPRI